MPVKDPYATLGVPRNADEATVKRAFRKLAQQYHPDRNQGSKAAEEKFKEINEAYQILTNPRAAADHARYAQQNGNNGGQRRYSRPYGGRADTQDYDADIREQTLRRMNNLTLQFNEYARFVGHQKQFRAAAKAHYRARHPGLGQIFKRYMMDDTRKAADALLETLANPTTAIRIKVEIETLSMAVNMLVASHRRLDAAGIDQSLYPLEQRVHKRLLAIQNGLDVLSGRSTDLRYRATNQPS
jgi:curved DNA-binding protein CbpA